jgi:predicted nucleic acid-binding protein
MSDAMKPRPDERVRTWMQAHEPELYTSAITVGEIRRGIARLPAGDRRSRLEHWLEGLLVRMHGRVLAYNVRVAETWGEMMADLERRGQKMPLADSLIAAVAKRHNLIVATRNTADFARAGLRVVNPFL